MRSGVHVFQIVGMEGVAEKGRMPHRESTVIFASLFRRVIQTAIAIMLIYYASLFREGLRFCYASLFREIFWILLL